MRTDITYTIDGNYKPDTVIKRQVNQIALHKEKKYIELVKLAIWAYFLLLIFEGALRKWFLPGLATPLLIVRDPIVLWLLVTAWSKNKLPPNPYLIGIIIIGIFSVFTAVILGHGNLMVALFGSRILILYFPMIFIIGRMFNFEDVIKLGRLTLGIAIPMALLITVQFYSPQSAWVNLGVGADKAGAGFSGAMDYFRPSGTFSFTNGTTLFFSLTACFIFYFWLNPSFINRWLLLGATVSLLIAIPISISRALLLQVSVTAFFTIIAIFHKPKYIGKMFIAIIGLAVTLIILSQISFFQTSIEVLTARFDTANEQGGGFEKSVVGRFFGDFLGPLTNADPIPFFGYGLGIGTNVGAQLLTGNRVFLVSENEWGRVLGELGPLLGFSVIFIRVMLTLKIAFISYWQLKKGDLMPWLLLSFGCTVLSQGGWAQPTSLGFCTLLGGLMVASLRLGKNKSI